MKNTEVDALEVWKQFEDDVVPQLRFSVIDRAVYSHLLRHSRLEKKRRVRFALSWLGRGTRLCSVSVRTALHRLFHSGALKLIECNKDGHVVQVRLPAEMRGVRVSQMTPAEPTTQPQNFEATDFLRTMGLRRSIHLREKGRCFYCLRRTRPRRRCIDHVVPRAMLGRNSYRNLVSAGEPCNVRKGSRPAEELLRWLFREHILSSLELRSRYRALNALKQGKLVPLIDASTPAFHRSLQP